MKKVLFFLSLFFLIWQTTSYAVFTCVGAAGGGNWNAAGSWTNCNSTVPQTGDSVTLTVVSGNIVVNANTNTLNSFDMTGYLGTLSGSNALTVGPSGGVTTNCILAGTVTFTGNLQFTMSSTNTVNFTSGGVLSSSALSILHAGTGTVSQQDSLTTAGTLSSSSSGSWNTNNNNITLKSYTSAGSTAGFSAGSSTLTFNGTSNGFILGPSATFTAGTSTIIISDTSSSGKLFTGTGHTFSTVTFSGDNITVSGDNTFSTLNVNNANLTNGLKLTSGTKQTVTTFTTNGSASNIAKISATTAGQFAALSDSSGTNTVTYTSLTDNLAMGGASWDASSGTNTNGGGNYGWVGMTAAPATTCYAGTHSTNTSNNSGWTFTAPPAGGSVIKTVNGLAVASVKTINGLAVASVKTINGAAAQ